MIKKNKSKKKYIQIRINNQIRYKEVRVLNEDGSNLGVMSSDKALESAQKLNLDLIEISGRSVPPLVKIADYGKFLYKQKKKQKELKPNRKYQRQKIFKLKLAQEKEIYY